MAHAFRTGALDFSKYRSGDPYWLMTEGLVLDDIESEFRSRVSSLTMMWHACAGQPTGWEEDDKRTSWHEREARKTWNDVGRCLLPWYDQFAEEKSLKQLWDEFIERGRDPIYAEWLRKERQRLRDMTREAIEGQQSLADIRKRLKTLKTLKSGSRKRKRV